MRFDVLLTDPRTQIATGLMQLVILTRVTFDFRAARADRPPRNPHDSFLSIRTAVVS